MIGGRQTYQEENREVYIKIAVQNVSFAHAVFLVYQVVLVLAGVELNFFIVAGMGLCFGFVLETV